MNSEADRAVLARTLRVDEIRDGASGKIAVTKAEMNAIAGMLDLVALEGLTFNYRLNHGGGGRLHLTGRRMPTSRKPASSPSTRLRHVSMCPQRSSFGRPV